jgi:GNAT superfamily N-acetyltransferase
MLTFHTMTPDDQGFFLGLIDTVGWGFTEADYRRMLAFSPDGMFKAAVGGVDVGVVVAVDYGEMGWIGNLVVVPEMRERGIGGALTRRAVEHLLGRGVRSIRLDGVQKAIPLYRRLGFRDEYRSLRYTGRASRSPVAYAEPMRGSDLDAVAELDEAFFKGRRGHMLRWVYDRFPDLCFASWSGGELTGFIMAKDGSDSVKVGPWICRPGYGAAAETLLQSVMNMRVGEEVWVGCPEGNRSSVAILERNGFTSLPSSLRMCYGDCGVREDVDGVYGLGGPDKG